MKTYQLKRDNADRVKAKVFEQGDEDGIKTILPMNRSKTKRRPYVVDLHSQEIIGDYGTHWLIVYPDHDRTLIEKEKFEREYEPINNR